MLVGVQVTASYRHRTYASTTSADEGRFVFSRLPIGLYELRAVSNGFERSFFRTSGFRHDTTAVSLILKSQRTAGWTSKPARSPGEYANGGVEFL